MKKNVTMKHWLENEELHETTRRRKTPRWFLCTFKGRRRNYMKRKIYLKQLLLKDKLVAKRYGKGQLVQIKEKEVYNERERPILCEKCLQFGHPIKLYKGNWELCKDCTEPLWDGVHNCGCASPARNTTEWMKKMTGTPRDNWERRGRWGSNKEGENTRRECP